MKDINDMKFEFTYPLDFDDQKSIDDYIHEYKKFMEKRNLRIKKELRVKKLNKLNE